MHVTEEHLQKAGLTLNEAKIYLFLIKEGPSNASSLAKKARIDRSLTYTILNNLTNKGLVISTYKGTKKQFTISSPENFFNPIKEQENYLNELIPALKSITTNPPTHYEVLIYEGKKGIRSFIQDILHEQHVDSFGATGGLFELLYELPTIIKERLKTVAIRTIISPQTKHLELFKKLHIKTRTLPTVNQATTCIYGNKISIHLTKSQPFMIVIKSKEIADTYRQHFELLWKLAKPF